MNANKLQDVDFVLALNTVYLLAIHLLVDRSVEIGTQQLVQWIYVPI